MKQTTKLIVPCLAVVLATSLAAADTILNLSDGQELGNVVPGEPAAPGDVATYVNTMIGLNLGASAPVTINGNTDTVTRSMNAFSPLDAAAAGPATAYGNLNVSTIVVDVTGYEYLAAKYDDGNAETEVWYVGNLSGNVDIPVFDGKYGISTTTLLSPTTPPPSVPDGGSTLLLLGSAISGLGLIRRKLSA